MRSVHAPMFGHVALNTAGAPANTPQMSMSKMTSCGTKNVLGSQDSAGYDALGVGQEVGSGELFWRSLGIDDVYAPN